MARNHKLLAREPSHSEIANRAQEIFNETGGIPGRDVENWLVAEAQIRAAIAIEAENQAKKKPQKTIADGRCGKPQAFTKHTF